MTRDPRGRLQVIPPGWSAHHRPTAYGFLTGDCQASRAGQTGDWLPGEPEPVPNVEVIFAHMPCSVQILTNSTTPIRVADGVEVLATHRVSVPIAATWLHYGETITVLDNPDDPDLNGRDFVVLVGETGTTNWTRDYLVQDRNRQEVAA